MRITKLDTLPFSVPLAPPPGGSAHPLGAGFLTYCLVRAETDSGLVGWGEISDGWGCEYAEVAGALVREALARFVVGQNPLDVSVLVQRMFAWLRSGCKLPQPTQRSFAVTHASHSEIAIRGGRCGSPKSARATVPHRGHRRASLTTARANLGLGGRVSHALHVRLRTSSQVRVREMAAHLKQTNSYHQGPWHALALPPSARRRLALGRVCPFWRPPPRCRC
jgi:hypothetical protein